MKSRCNECHVIGEGVVMTRILQMGRVAGFAVLFVVGCESRGASRDDGIGLDGNVAWTAVSDAAAPGFDGWISGGDAVADAPPASSFGSDGSLAKDGESSASDGSLVRGEESCELTAGPFEHIYDPSPSSATPWYINDHTIVRGPDGQWHLFGITHEEPSAPQDERVFAHATSPTLTTPTWTRRPPAMVVDEASGERVLWAPYVLLVDRVYHMFYGAGGDSDRFQIRHATSSDLWAWTRDPRPLFTDGFHARDPFVIRVGSQWVMYYTATSEPAGGNHVVAYRTSDNLVDWSERSIAYRDEATGTFAGNTESPYVLARQEGYYLFIGPRARGLDPVVVEPDNKDYDSTEVFFSGDPFRFDSPPLARFPAHAAELVEDLDGKLWMTRCGWGRGGVYIAPLAVHCKS